MIDTLRTLEDLEFIFDAAGSGTTDPHVQQMWLKIAEHLRAARRLHREADALTGRAQEHDPSCALMQPPRTEPIRKSAAFPHGGIRFLDPTPPLLVKCTCVVGLRETLAERDALIEELRKMLAECVGADVTLPQART